MQKLSKPADWILPVPFTFTKGIYRCGVSRGALPHMRQILSPTEWGTCYLYGRQVQCISNEVNRPIIFRYLTAAQVSYVGTCGIICKCISHATFTLTGGQNGQLILYVPTCMYSLTGYLPTQRYLSACVGDFLSSLCRSVLRISIGYVLFRCENFRPEGMQVYHYSFILKRGMGMHRGTRQTLRFLTDWQKINAQVFSGCGQSGKYHILPER